LKHLLEILAFDNLLNFRYLVLTYAKFIQWNPSQGVHSVEIMRVDDHKWRVDKDLEMAVMGCFKVL
jgi:hypothetical protein